MGRLQGTRKLVLDSGPGLPGLLSRSHASLHMEPSRGLLLSGPPGARHIMSSSWQPMPQTQTVPSFADHSTNGCYVNDARVEASQPVNLQDGDLLSFGGHRWVFPLPPPHTECSLAQAWSSGIRGHRHQPCMRPLQGHKPRLGVME